MDSKKTPLEQSTVIEPKPPSQLPRLTLALIIFILLIAGYLILNSRNQQQTANPPPPQTTTTVVDSTANWKTYSNNLFSFKYPSQLILSDEYSTEENIPIKLSTVENDKYNIAITATVRNPDELVDLVPLKSTSERKIIINKVPVKFTTGNVDLPKSNSNEWLTRSETVFNNGYYYTFTLFTDNNTISSDLFFQILSTFHFLDNNGVTSTPEIIETINYQTNSEWNTFRSNTGYSVQYPPSFELPEGNREQFNVYNSGECSIFFNNNAGGIIAASVYPYNGGSRRELPGVIIPGYNYNFKDVYIQGKKSLLVQAGPAGDSGSGTKVIVPIGNTALIVSFANRTMDNANFIQLLQSISFSEPLDISQCGK